MVAVSPRTNPRAERYGDLKLVITCCGKRDWEASIVEYNRPQLPNGPKLYEGTRWSVKYRSEKRAIKCGGRQMRKIQQARDYIRHHPPRVYKLTESGDAMVGWS